MEEILHSLSDGRVVREIRPGDYESRQYKVYPNRISAVSVQWLAAKSFIPDLLVQLVDDGRTVGADILDQREPVVEEEFSHAA
ncbi:MAG TPA: hypothetical protein VHA05_03055 [Candidatus Saccharimonadales bacterium]|nr:hypothetical protein [Candidatus Saccharimonadales bacterium]